MCQLCALYLLRSSSSQACPGKSLSKFSNIEEGLLDLANNVNSSSIVIGNDSNPFGDDDYTDDWGPSEEIKKKASFDTSSCKQILFEF